MWKFYIIEIVGNFPILFGLFSILVIILIICLISKYNKDMLDVFYREDRDIIKAKFKKRFSILLITLILSLSIAVLTPSKVFMYSVTGIDETIKFLQGNDEVKKISSKTLQIINNKLDKYIENDNEDLIKEE